MTGWLHETFRLTVVLLAASLCLIVPGALDAAGPPLLLLLAGLAVGAFTVRESLRGIQPRLGVPVGGSLAIVWLGPVVAAGMVLLTLGATPGEVQALGGLLGLAAMLNYFLRPVYYAVYATGRRVASAI
jgi:hypothetical protein